MNVRIAAAVTAEKSMRHLLTRRYTGHLQNLTDTVSLTALEGLTYASFSQFGASNRPFSVFDGRGLRWTTNEWLRLFLKFRQRIF